MHFWSFWAKYCHFLHILSNARPKNNVNKVPRWVFRYVGNKTFDFSSKKRIFCPKTTQFGPKLAFLVNLGQAMQAYSVPCWWVGWWLWRAGCISQDTYLLYYCHYLLQHHRQQSTITIFSHSYSYKSNCNIRLLARAPVFLNLTSRASLLQTGLALTFV